MHIRDAIATDAEAACRVLRRSVVELCVADHRNDQHILISWLRNKRAETFISWLTPSHSIMVAEDAGAVLAVGGVLDSGELTLNYVAPLARFRGISRAMVAALEGRARARGHSRCFLESTRTALRFYRAQGYVAVGLPSHVNSVTGYPMMKTFN